MKELTDRRPTMLDVARQAGVSLKTVSRVVNREDGVSADLAARVESAVASLSYRPDDRARRLRRYANHTGSIGFVLVDVANPFFSAILRGIEEEARNRDCLVLAGSTDGSEERERQLIEAFIDRRVDGLILVPSGEGLGPLRDEIDRGTPVVVVDLELAGDQPVDLVRSDHYGGGVAATRHLIDHGHTEIAYLGDDPSIFSARLRLDGFRHAMKSAGLKAPPSREVFGSHSAEEWRPIALNLFSTDPAPTAVFTAQNFATIGAVHALHDLGLQHKVALVGFDDVDLAGAVDPGLTVVPQEPRQLGRRAAELLFERIDGLDHPRRNEIIDHRLVRRGSGEIRPA
ncbi:MAG TPA: LacI family DNA-binding transcriptional regulator [Acidimicrobiia bacterium]|nr:LacI family DNA-binding transcriptional regulator [Acidimicrobiia bacterium]